MVARIRQILSNETRYKSVDIDEILENIQKENNIQYDRIQIEAVKTAIRSKFMILTGGPGTGKTTRLSHEAKFWKLEKSL